MEKVIKLKKYLNNNKKLNICLEIKYRKKY